MNNKIVCTILLTFFITNCNLAFGQLREVQEFYKDGTPMKAVFKNDDLQVVKTETYGKDGKVETSFNYDPITGKKHGDFKLFMNSGFYNQGILNCEKCTLSYHAYKGSSIWVGNVKNGAFINDVEIFQFKDEMRGCKSIISGQMRRESVYDLYPTLSKVGDIYEIGRLYYDGMYPNVCEHEIVYKTTLHYNKKGNLHGKQEISDLQTLFYDNGDLMGFISLNDVQNTVVKDSVFRENKLWKFDNKYMENTGVLYNLKHSTLEPWKLSVEISSDSYESNRYPFRYPFASIEEQGANHEALPVEVRDDRIDYVAIIDFRASKNKKLNGYGILEPKDQNLDDSKGLDLLNGKLFNVDTLSLGAIKCLLENYARSVNLSSRIVSYSCSEGTYDHGFPFKNIARYEGVLFDQKTVCNSLGRAIKNLDSSHIRAFYVQNRETKALINIQILQLETEWYKDSIETQDSIKRAQEKAQKEKKRNLMVEQAQVTTSNLLRDEYVGLNENAIINKIIEREIKFAIDKIGYVHLGKERSFIDSLKNINDGFRSIFYTKKDGIKNIAKVIEWLYTQETVFHDKNLFNHDLNKFSSVYSMSVSELYGARLEKLKLPRNFQYETKEEVCLKNFVDAYNSFLKENKKSKPVSIIWQYDISRFNEEEYIGNFKIKEILD